MWDILYRHDGTFFTTVESHEALNRALDLGFIAYRHFPAPRLSSEPAASNILFREEGTGKPVSIWA